jgi:hypothetical protein
MRRIRETIQVEMNLVEAKHIRHVLVCSRRITKSSDRALRQRKVYFLELDQLYLSTPSEMDCLGKGDSLCLFLPFRIKSTQWRIHSISFGILGNVQYGQTSKTAAARPMPENVTSGITY